MGHPGSLNKRAVAKFITLFLWIGVSFLIARPFIPLNYAVEYVQDVQGFMENNTTWWNLSRSGRVFYVVFPIPWFIGAAVWYEGWFRKRRKRLIVNGQPEGVVMLVVGDPNYKDGHLYDLACVLNGFKHIKWSEFPRPILGNLAPPGVTIYYRSALFWNPITYAKISTRPENITYGYRTIWLEGKYRMRMRHKRRPVLDFEVIYDGEPPYKTVEMTRDEFVMAHRNTQETILKDNYRMTIAEPGVAKLLSRSSMMVISEDTRNEYIDQLPTEVQRRYLEAAARGEQFDGKAQG